MSFIHSSVHSIVDFEIEISYDKNYPVKCR